jgi:heavy metal sensor kinase
MMFSTIRARLSLWTMALLAAMLAAFCALLYVNLSRSLRDDADRWLALDAQRLTATLDIENGVARPGEGFDSLQVGTAAMLFDSTGRRLIATTMHMRAPDMTRELLRAKQGQRTLVRVGFPGDGVWRVLTVPVIEDGQQVAVLQVARSERDINTFLGRLVTVMAIAIPLTLLLAVAGGIFLAGRALNPIDRITRTAEQIGSRDLTRRLDMVGNDEVGRLAATFDRMLDRLQAAFQRQRQFTADASHELRTPLAMIASQLDLALERPRTTDEYRAVLASLREDTSRLSRLTSQLLSLARSDAGEQILELEPLDLATITEEVVATMRPLAQAATVDLTQHAGAGLLVNGDQTRLTQLLVNLIDNAIKYTPPGGRVSVSARQEGEWAVVTVTDTGQGIAAEHLPHLFERFYRADPSRSRQAGGSGLGLAICRWIVEAHGGEISATSQPGQGTTITVRLRRADLLK